MNFSELHRLLVEKFEAPDAADKKKAARRDALKKAARGEEDREAIAKKSSVGGKIGAAIGSKVGRAIAGDETPKQAQAEYTAGVQNNTPASDLPSWIWRKLINDKLSGQAREDAVDLKKKEYTTAKDEFQKKQADDDSEKDSKDDKDDKDTSKEEPEGEPKEKTPNEIKSEVFDKVEKAEKDFLDNDTEFPEDDINELIDKLPDEEKEATKNRIKKRMALAKQQKKDEKAAGKEEKEDSATSSSAKKFDLNK
jgi:hypothetical protein